MVNQDLQGAFLNSVRKDRTQVTIYLASGVKLSGRVKGFDKFCVVFETPTQEQLIFKHAISTVVITDKRDVTEGNRLKQTSLENIEASDSSTKDA